MAELKHCIECGKPLFDEDDPNRIMTVAEMDNMFCGECRSAIDGDDGYDEIDQAEIIENKQNENDK